MPNLSAHFFSLSRSLSLTRVASTISLNPIQFGFNSAQVLVLDFSLPPRFLHVKTNRWEAFNWQSRVTQLGRQSCQLVLTNSPVAVRPLEKSRTHRQAAVVLQIFANISAPIFAILIINARLRLVGQVGATFVRSIRSQSIGEPPPVGL